MREKYMIMIDMLLYQDCNVTIGVQWKSKNAEIMFELQGISRAIIFLMGGGGLHTTQYLGQRWHMVRWHDMGYM